MLEYDSQHAQIERIRILPHVVNPLFWLAVGLAEALLFVAILPLLLVYCVYYRGGFEWQADNTYTTMFNIHPLTMVLGFIILYSQGVLVYRVLPIRKTEAKILHASIQFIVGGCVAFGFAVIILTKRKLGEPHLFSLHSWLGIVTGALFTIQFLAGAFTYLIPNMPLSIRALLMPFHRFGGLAIFALSVVTCISGLQEKILPSMSPMMGKHSCKKYVVVGNKTTCTGHWSYFDKPPEGMVLNSLGVAICLAVAVVALIVTQTGWQRKARGSDTVHLLGSN